MKIKILLFGCVFGLLLTTPALSQISPGDLAEAHADLEGISNCTLCHTLGDQVSSDKCLDCHSLLKKQIDANKGYHVSNEVKQKTCTECHNDHHGRKFELIRFDKDAFDHSLTGYKLEGAHKEKKCVDCHKNEFISNKKIKEKKFTFLGMNTKCLSCHDDYHQQTLSEDCASCHEMKKFKPADKFDHNNTDYTLLGKHKDVACEKCHPKEIRNSNDFQVFSGIKFDRCTQCHEDVHHDKFGQNCSSCHTENSFQLLKKTSQFNHNKTDYPLKGKHIQVDCKKCHKSKYTDPISFNKCSNCHVDYHQQQFEKQGSSPDCSSCHRVNGFKESSYTLERHQQSNFKLEDAHLATPCFACHLKKDRWEFKQKGLQCTECHENIHKDAIDQKYYPENNCKACHSVSLWKNVVFDHSSTKFELEGSHQQQTCRSCHFIESSDKKTIEQKFKNLSTACVDCHDDIHQGQFELQGATNCRRCHSSNKWKDMQFDHSKTKFPLDGKHKDVDCNKCHKEKKEGQLVYTVYKIKNFKCKDCH